MKLSERRLWSEQFQVLNVSNWRTAVYFAAQGLDCAWPAGVVNDCPL